MLKFCSSCGQPLALRQLAGDTRARPQCTGCGTIHYENPDPACDLDYVPNESRDTAVSVALSNSFAFGGNSSVVVIGRYS